MNPDNALAELREAFGKGEMETARERATALRDWLRDGGEAPANAMYKFYLCVVLDT
jgi:hypothetical protein